MSTFRKGATSTSSEEDGELRRGPWTLEEDNLLTHYISCHGEGRWNLLALRSGLRRTGKSCRLRWMNYLKPDIKHGNLSLEEQVLILELHSKLGNRWSKIAQCLPGRTDNEIKNYWRTRVQKQARNLSIDTNSTAFQDVLRCFWIPRLLQKIETPCSSSSPPNLALPPSTTQVLKYETYDMNGTPFYGSNHHQKSSIISSGNCTSPSICSSLTINECPYQVSEYPINPFCLSVNNDHYCLDNGVSNIGTFSLESMLDEPIGASQVDDNSWVDNSLIDCLWNGDDRNGCTYGTIESIRQQFEY